MRLQSRTDKMIKNQTVTAKGRYSFRTVICLISVLLFLFALTSCDSCSSEHHKDSSKPAKNTPISDQVSPKDIVKFRLMWVPQAQFAGFIIADYKGFYRSEGIDIKILPAGPDLKPHVTVATGSDDIGIAVPNQIIAARSNGVPLVAIMQTFQDSANRYILKDKNRIKNLQELKGKKVGLWLGGDEAEFISMLGTVGMTLADVKVIPQEFSVIPFLEDVYVLSQVTVYNELNVIRGKGYTGDKLQVLSPRDYNSAILGDVVFTSEDYLQQNADTVQRFLTASIKGWKYCLTHKQEALDILLKYNPELDRENQRAQLDSALDLLVAGMAIKEGLGYISLADYNNAQRILLESKQITKKTNMEKAIDMSAWSTVDKSIVRVSP